MTGWLGGWLAGWVDPDENNASLALSHRSFPQGRVWQNQGQLDCVEMKMAKLLHFKTCQSQLLDKKKQLFSDPEPYTFFQFIYYV